MESFYCVTRNGIPCGKVAVSRQGLYYRFHCRCAFPDKDIFRLVLSKDGSYENLGILIPSGESFELTTKLPAKRFPEGEWSFHITSGRETTAEYFVPIRPEEPFAYLSRLKDSFLTYQNGQPGIRITKMQE